MGRHRSPARLADGPLLSQNHLCRAGQRKRGTFPVFRFCPVFAERVRTRSPVGGPAPLRQFNGRERTPREQWFFLSGNPPKGLYQHPRPVTTVPA